MGNKRVIGISILVSVIITFLGCLVLGRIFFQENVQPKTVQTPVVTTATDGFENTVLNALSTAAESVVSISVSKDIKAYAQDPTQTVSPGAIQQTKLGGASGILISREGYVLTSKHVFTNTGAVYEVTLANGKSYPVDKVRFDDALDLAVVKLVGSGVDFPVARFISWSQPARIGQFVLAIGNASTDAMSVTFGILSSMNKTFNINTTNIYAGLYQTDALVVAGGSGGPLLDLQGQVLGVNTAVDTTQGRAFALPVSREFIETTLASLAKYGKIVRPLLGIQYKDITLALSKEKKLPVSAGVIISDVLAGLPAAEGGLQAGDIIVKINDKDITAQSPFLYQIYTYLPGTTLILDVIRKGGNIKVQVVLGENGV